MTEKIWAKLSDRRRWFLLNNSEKRSGFLQALIFVLTLIIIAVCYTAAMLLCSAAMLYVPRWVAWIGLPLYCGLGCFTTWLCRIVSPDARKRLFIASILILLTCAVDVFRGLSYRDLAAFLFASALMGSASQY
jgi:hypothetical protein